MPQINLAIIPTYNKPISMEFFHQQIRSAIAEFIANQNSFYTQKAYLYELRQYFLEQLKAPD